MGLVKVTLQFAAVVLIFYILAAIVEGEMWRVDRLFNNTQEYIQQIASMNQSTVLGVGLVLAVMYVVFTK